MTQAQGQEIIDLWYISRLSKSFIARKVKVSIDDVIRVLEGDTVLELRVPDHLPHWRIRGGRLPL